METTKDLLIIFFRIITIIPLLLIVTKMMGRRSIAQLPVFDFLIIITLGSIVGADLAVPGTPHTPTVFAVIAVTLLQIVVARAHILHKGFGHLITFDPVIVVHNGIMLENNLKKIRYSIDDLLLLLRGNGIFDISEVHIAIIEANGQITVHKNPLKETVTIEDIGIKRKSTGIAFPIIIDGELKKETLTSLKISEKWFLQQLKELHITEIQSVFFASITEDHQLQISLRENEMFLTAKLPPIFH